MSCGTCNGGGFVQATWKDVVEMPGVDSLPGTDVVNCPDCTTECSSCQDTGFIVNEEKPYDKERCRACWVWTVCDTCLGQGRNEDGFTDPNTGQMVGGMVDCQFCDGDGYTISGWCGNGIPPEDSFQTIVDAEEYYYFV